MKSYKFSIKFKYTFYVLIIFVVISLTSIMTTSFFFNKMIISYYRNEISSLFSLLKPEIFTCIKNLNYAGLEKRLTWLIKFKDINGIYLLDSNGNIIIKRGIERGFKVKKDFPYGSLIAYFNKFNLINFKKGLLKNTILIFLYTLPLIVILTLTLVNFHLRNILSLSNLIKNFGNPEFLNFQYPKFKAKDEISEITEILIKKHFQLIENKKLLSLLYTAIKQCYNSIVITDINGKILYVNSAFTKITEFDASEAIGKTPNIVKSGKQSKEFYENMWNTILNGNIWEGQLINKTKSGKFYIEKMNITPVKNEEGEIQYFIAIKQDITREIENEKKLLKMEKLKIVETMASGVAHEINNLLISVVSYPDILINFLDNKEKIIKGLKEIQTAGLKISEILLDLTALSPKIALPKQRINLNNVIDECINSNEIAELLNNKDITIQKILDKNLNFIKGTYSYIYKSIINLIKNAIEAIKLKGKILITTENIYLNENISEKFEVNEGEYVKLTIKDTGEGISEEDIDRIFDPFFTKKKLGRKSTGVGLTIVWNTIKSHNGAIEVKSDKTGTSFFLYFPAVKEKLISDYKKIKIEKKYSILVVDDEESQREIILEILLNNGFDVKTVSSGEEAIEYIKRNKVDLIILDMIMEPGIDGCETFERIKKINPNQKAIIISGMSYSERINRALSLGVKDFIKKPYTSKQLINIVKANLV